jgi:Flp pilus assembly protein TadD
MVEDIIYALTMSRALRVVGSGSTHAYRKGAVDPVQVGRDLGVRFLLEGNVRRVRDMFSVTAQLLEAATGGVLWVQKFERPVAEISDLQEDLVMDVAGSLVGEIERKQVERALRGASGLDVWEARHRVLSLLWRFEEPKALAEAEALLKLAPDSALAMSCVAVTAGILVGVHDAGPNLRPRALALARQAIREDPEQPIVLAYAGLGLAFLSLAEEGLVHLERARELAPGNAEVRICLSWVYTMLNKPDAALAELRAFNRLSPRSPQAHLALRSEAQALVRAGRFEDGLSAADRALRIFPGDYPSMLVRCVCLLRLGQPVLAKEAISRAAQLRQGQPFPEKVFDLFWGGMAELSSMKSGASQAFDEARRELGQDR